MPKTSVLKKLATVAAVVAVAIVGTVAATPGVAHATGTLTFRLAADSQPAEFADVSGASTASTAGDQLFQAPCTGNVGEIWDYTNSLATWDAAYNIWNPHSNLYMEVYGGSTSRGASIDAWYFDGFYFCGQWVCEQRNQEWLLESV
jgi:hypothetical protein